MSDSYVFQVNKDRILTVEKGDSISENSCYACLTKATKTILIKVSYHDGAFGLSLCENCSSKVLEGINQFI